MTHLIYIQRPRIVLQYAARPRPVRPVSRDTVLQYVNDPKTMTVSTGRGNYPVGATRKRDGICLTCKNLCYPNRGIQVRESPRGEGSFRFVNYCPDCGRKLYFDNEYLHDDITVCVRLTRSQYNYVANHPSIRHANNNHQRRPLSDRLADLLLYHQVGYESLQTRVAELEAELEEVSKAKGKSKKS